MSSPEPHLEADPLIESYRAHVDRTLVRRIRERRVEERLDALIELQRFAEELRRADERVPAR